MPFPRPMGDLARPPAPIVQKIAVRWAKRGLAIWHSHHDWMRFWERAIRRAGMPVRLTEGFNPRPRLVFPHALGVGVASEDEWVEMELTGARPPAWFMERLSWAVAGVVEVLAVEELSTVRKGRTVAMCAYRVEGLPADAELSGRLAARMLALAEYPVSRGPEREAQRVDARPYLARAEGAGPGAVRLALLHTPQGAGRVDEWARWLGQELGMDGRRLFLLKEKTVFERERPRGRR